MIVPMNSARSIRIAAEEAPYPTVSSGIARDLAGSLRSETTVSCIDRVFMRHPSARQPRSRMLGIVRHRAPPIVTTPGAFGSISRRGAVRKSLCIIGNFTGAALACLLAFGCAPQPPPRAPAETLNLIRAGQPMLTCREQCLAEWRQVQPQAAQLDASGRWQELALLLARIGYQDDLSLYYLGRAAEGIGGHVAAIAYYRQSAQLSATANSCHNLSRVCGGVALPRAALARATVIEHAMARARYRRAGPSSGPEVPEAAPEEIAEPPATPMAAPIPLPAPPPSPNRAPPSEFIEPPPAPR